MYNWFTIEKIDDDTYAISEYKHWEQTHCYLLLGKQKSILIDTGLGIENIKTVVSSITDKPIQVITTHVHWDHIGGHKYFNNICVYEKEKEWIDGHFPLPLQAVKSNLLKEPCNFPQKFDVNDYKIFQGKPKSILYDNDVINFGGRNLQILYTPGHSPGHICLYEEDRGYLFSGDLIYEGTLDSFYPSTNPVDFMNSIKKVKNFDVNRILPGHYSLNVPNDFICKIDGAFSELYLNNKLKQGNGIFQFNGFSIHI